MQKYTRKRPLTWKSFWPIYIILIVALGLKIKTHFSQPAVPTATVPSVTHDQVVESPVTEPTTEPTTTPTAEPSTEPTAPPSEFNLAVPFSSQAPTGNWDAFHEDTCEEASVYMVTEFYNGNKSEVADTTAADKFYTDMMTWETAQGYGGSITADELLKTIAANTTYTGKVVENPTVDELKGFIAKGEPIIVPAAGRKLGNPFFTGIGPLYHMLVIRGYTADGKFITNDPGTHHGENYSYTTDVLMNAIGDWNAGDPEHGAKRVVVIAPK